MNGRLRCRLPRCKPDRSQCTDHRTGDRFRSPWDIAWIALQPSVGCPGCGVDAGRWYATKAGHQARKYFGAGGGTRTHTVSPQTDFESVASTNSATPAARRHYSDVREAVQNNSGLGLGIRSLRDPARFARYAFATFATLTALGRDSGSGLGAREKQMVRKGRERRKQENLMSVPPLRGLNRPTRARFRRSDQAPSGADPTGTCDAGASVRHSLESAKDAKDANNSVGWVAVGLRHALCVLPLARLRAFICALGVLCGPLFLPYSATHGDGR